MEQARSDSPSSPAPSLDDSVGLLHLFADSTRVRLLSLLTGAQLSVAELTAITGLSQSRVSTHLGRLRDAGFLRDRRDGAKTFSELNEEGMRPEARRLWHVVRDQTRDAVLESDLERRGALLTSRAARECWPDHVAGQMERHYSPGRTWEALTNGLLGLVRSGDVVDIGCGDGSLARMLAPRVGSYTGVDRSDKILAAARGRLGESPRVRFVRGDMHELPFEDASFDHALLFHVLGYSHDAAQALREAARLLRSGGELTIITLAAHRRASVTDSYGHVNQGFKVQELEALVTGAGLRVERCGITSRERRKPHFEVITVNSVLSEGATEKRDIVHG